MKPSIAIIDYGMGNIGSVQSALARLGANCFVSRDLNELATANAFVLPGVGAFGAAMANLESHGLPAFLKEQVVETGKPFLGICLGMQLLAEDSTEMGHYKGLGWIEGHVVELDHNRGRRVPHVGWSPLRWIKMDRMEDRLDPQAHFYFDHSYHLICNPEHVVAWCDYGEPVVAAVQRGNIFATQFHPEKSQRSGLKLLRNFLRFAEEKKVS
jgi:imidazole glycerol-phosphate synthase subunit HisH